jgi:hypothetical protein
MVVDDVSLPLLYRSAIAGPLNMVNTQFAVFLWARALSFTAFGTKVPLERTPHHG